MRSSWCSSRAGVQALDAARADPAAPGGQPAGRGASDRPPDAGPGTFYSAMSNIDLEIGDGNPGAVGVRAHYAQHCFLAHMDFHIGSGLAGIHEGGNVAEDVHFYGGQYGIWTRTPSPGWQFTLVDATFEGPARGRHPGARRRPHAHPPAVPERSHGHRHRTRLSRRTLGEGCPHGGHLGPRRDHQPREQPADRDQHGKRGLPPRARLRLLPRERQEGRRARRHVRGQGVLPRLALRRHRRRPANQGHFRNHRR